MLLVNHRKKQKAVQINIWWYSFGPHLVVSRKTATPCALEHARFSEGLSLRSAHVVLHSSVTARAVAREPSVTDQWHTPFFSPRHATKCQWCKVTSLLNRKLITHLMLISSRLFPITGYWCLGLLFSRTQTGLAAALRQSPRRWESACMRVGRYVYYSPTNYASS